jgi:hypothetical protein
VAHRGKQTVLCLLLCSDCFDGAIWLSDIYAFGIDWIDWIVWASFYDNRTNKRRNGLCIAAVIRNAAKSDYDVWVEIKPQMIIHLFAPAKHFIETIENLLNIKTDS